MLSALTVKLTVFSVASYVMPGVVPVVSLIVYVYVPGFVYVIVPNVAVPLPVTLAALPPSTKLSPVVSVLLSVSVKLNVSLGASASTDFFTAGVYVISLYLFVMTSGALSVISVVPCFTVATSVFPSAA